MDAPPALFDPIDPHDSGLLPLDDLHTMYWERCGAPAGVPVVFLHGGPGAGISPASRRFFRPEAYDIVLFDQRGAGRSTPLGETRQNDTTLLIEDIETLRRHLGIEKWLVFGGSWGSTLALAYAQAHPDRCLGLALRGIWLVSDEEIDWWLYGIRNFFPREWEAFAGHVEASERHDLLAAYQRRLTAERADVYLPAARAWSRYEGSCLQLRPDSRVSESFGSDAVALGVGRLEAHYFQHRAFLKPEQLLNGMPRIAHLPGCIVHGRYDVICPVRYAYALADRWPGVHLDVIADAGHTAFEPGIAAALVAATERFHLTGRFD